MEENRCSFHTLKLSSLSRVEVRMALFGPVSSPPSCPPRGICVVTCLPLPIIPCTTWFLLPPFFRRPSSGSSVWLGDMSDMRAVFAGLCFPSVGRSRWRNSVSAGYFQIAFGPFAPDVEARSLLVTTVCKLFWVGDVTGVLFGVLLLFVCAWCWPIYDCMNRPSRLANLCIQNFWISELYPSSRNPEILCAIHHRQNPSENYFMYIFLLLNFSLDRQGRRGHRFICIFEVPI
jgi:hypothetical protein